MRYVKSLLKGMIVAAAVTAMVFAYKLHIEDNAGTLKKAGSGSYDEEYWSPVIAKSVNEKTITLFVDGEEVSIPGAKAFMDNTMSLMAPVALVQESFDCIAGPLENNQLKVEKNDNTLIYDLDAAKVYINDREQELKASITAIEDQIYLPVEVIAEAFSYSYEWIPENNQALLESTDANELLAAYDYREEARQPQIRDQGNFGTCWAFAALSALESSLLPEESHLFAPDHMSIKNNFGMTQDTGGEYTMSIAYLVGWQGPVFEKDDPYGDGKSPDGLSAVKHVQEVQLIEEKNYDEIKRAVYKYGGVQTSIYNSLANSFSKAPEYNKEHHAYCYTGDQLPNHEVLIIGWDDNYPKENFNGGASRDGAFICQNSWGSIFGEDGVFYISYDDTKIGANNVVYTKTEEVDNYSQIYQADLCGWTGQLGYGEESAFFANVFTAESSEKVAAAGFYATEKESAYKIFAVPQFIDKESLREPVKVAEGKLKNAGYYTIPFEEAVEITAGSKFALIVEITSPGTTYPVAVEFQGEDLPKDVDLSDGEGYISANGKLWEETESRYSCNVCLKAYTIENK